MRKFDTPSAKAHETLRKAFKLPNKYFESVWSNTLPHSREYQIAIGDRIRLSFVGSTYPRISVTGYSRVRSDMKPHYLEVDISLGDFDASLILTIQDLIRDSRDLIDAELAKNLPNDTKIQTQTLLFE